MTQGQEKYRPHSVIREDRPDGSILLKSGYGLHPAVRCTGEWLHHWAEQTPGAVFLAERSGEGWREVTYGEALQQVRALAAALLDRGLGADTPIMIISGNSVDHGLLSMAAHYVGVPTVPVAEQYALIPGARVQLEYIAGLIQPKMVFADDGARYEGALKLPCFDGLEKVVSWNPGEGMTGLANLLAASGDVSEAYAKVGPETIAKILMTSGSTSHPKGVLTPHRMMCTNQAQLQEALPFLTVKPPRLVDWLPWNHVFGGSHNFNLVLANGGSLYVDAGKPVAGLVETSLENLRMVTGTIAFNVPVGFAMIRDAMKTDKDLRRRYFEDLDMLFYAGASLPQDVWADLEAMAREVRGDDLPLFTSSWGLTETAPGCLLQHEPTTMSGIVGVPLAGLTVKLIPDEDMRCEIRVKGPSIFEAYYRDPEKTAEAFDEEGYFMTGDAMKFVDETNPNMGMRFDGRVAEDFKLLSGTWVRAANLRLELLPKLAGLAQDVILTGADRYEIGMMIVPSPDVRARQDVSDDGGAMICPSAAAEIGERLHAVSGQGSSTRIRRVMLLSEPPSIADGEITAKGNLNFHKILTRREALLERLYNDDDLATIKLDGGGRKPEPIQDHKQETEQPRMSLMARSLRALTGRR